MSQNCLFICSPSLGLLDNWIPVLNKLKKQKFKIDIFFPKITTVEQFNTSNFLSKEAFKTFNNVIYQDLYDDLFITKFNKKFVEDIGLNKTLKKTRSKIMRFINQEAFLGDKIFYALCSNPLRSNNSIVVFFCAHMSTATPEKKDTINFAFLDNAKGISEENFHFLL